ncbi:hypothetical protein B9X45_17060 [Acinetobacter pittii]|nr:hypothetical protein B9X45_17060 [Acinetobacter pittii]
MLSAVQPNICFIGSSNLALALIGGLVLKGFKKEKIHLANSNMRCDSFKSHMIINKLSKFL